MSEAKNVAAMPTRAATKRLGECTTLQEAFATEELRRLVAGAVPKHLNAETMLRTWVQAASRQPLIYKADLRQALGAFQSLAYLGLVPNTALQHAHIIPFKRMKWNPRTRAKDIEVVDLQVIIGYPGYIELGHRAGAVKSLHADVVYDRHAEGFSYSYGSRKHLDHAGYPPGYMPRGTPQYAYCHVATADDEQFEVMTWPEIEAIRGRSQGYRSALYAKEEAEKASKRLPLAWTEAPWVRDPIEMGKKTVVRRTYKWIPKAPELQAAAALEDAGDRGERLDFGPIIDGTATPFDGVPLTEDEDQAPEPPSQPGAAFTDRRPAAPQERPQAAAPPPRAEHAPPAPPPPTTAPSPPPGNATSHSAPAFEGMLIDGSGDVTDEVFTDPVAFAKAAVLLWEDTMPPDRAALLEFNADSLEDARQVPEAAAILSALEPAPGEPPADAQAGTPAEEPGKGELEVTPKPIEPPMERGKVSWTGYVRLLKAALVELDPRDLDLWAQAQLDHLNVAPRGQQLVAVAAIVNAYKMQGWSEPAWVADMTRGTKPDAPANPVTPEQADGARRWLPGAKKRISRCDTPAALAEFRKTYSDEINWVIGNDQGLAEELRAALRSKEMEFEREQQQQAGNE